MADYIWVYMLVLIYSYVFNYNVFKIRGNYSRLPAWG